MATTLATQIQAAIQATLSNVQDLVTGEAPLNQRFSVNLATGTGAGLADVMWSDTRSLGTGASEDLDMAGGGLVDAFGNAFAPARVKALIVFARAANTTNLTVGGDANSVPFFDAAADSTTLLPGGLLVLVNPSAAGWAVAAGATDIIQVANSAGATATYDIVVIGASA